MLKASIFRVLQYERTLSEEKWKECPSIQSGSAISSIRALSEKETTPTQYNPVLGCSSNRDNQRVPSNTDAKTQTGMLQKDMYTEI